MAEKRVACPRCGWQESAYALVCGLCGEPVGRATTGTEVERKPRPLDRAGAILSPPIEAPIGLTRRKEERVLGMPAHLFHLALGLLLAQVFTLGDVSWFAWFLSSLVHEMGHCAASLLTGAPSFPVISLDGHAMAVEGMPSLSLAFASWIILGGLAWRLRDRSSFSLPLAGLIVLGAFTTLIAGRETLILVMGHGGELFFAGIFFVRCLTGGAHERTGIACVLYAIAGWYLVLSNATLFWGLATSSSAVLDYYGSGSFGLANDFQRLATEVLIVPIGRLATGMLLASLAVLPCSFAVVRWRGGE